MRSRRLTDLTGYQHMLENGETGLFRPHTQTIHLRVDDPDDYESWPPNPEYFSEILRDDTVMNWLLEHEQNHKYCTQYPIPGMLFFKETKNIFRFYHMCLLLTNVDDINQEIRRDLITVTDRLLYESHHTNQLISGSTAAMELFSILTSPPDSIRSYYRLLTREFDFKKITSTDLLQKNTLEMLLRYTTEYHIEALKALFTAITAYSLRTPVNPENEIIGSPPDDYGWSDVPIGLYHYWRMPDERLRKAIYHLTTILGSKQHRTEFNEDIARDRERLGEWVEDLFSQLDLPVQKQLDFDIQTEMHRNILSEIDEIMPMKENRYKIFRQIVEKTHSEDLFSPLTIAFHPTTLPECCLTMPSMSEDSKYLISELYIVSDMKQQFEEYLKGENNEITYYNGFRADESVPETFYQLADGAQRLAELSENESEWLKKYRM